MKKRDERRLVTRAGSLATAAAAAMAALAAVGCAATASGTSPEQRPAGRQPAGQEPALAAFVGYKWLVTTITRDGKRTLVPARDDVYMLFTPNGQFGGNDPVNFHFGAYRQVGDGFTTDGLAITAVGYAGGNPVTELAISAISAFDNGVHAAASVTGNRLAVSVGGYLLNCQRDGIEPNLPPASPT